MRSGGTVSGDRCRREDVPLITLGAPLASEDTKESHRSLDLRGLCNMRKSPVAFCEAGSFSGSPLLSMYVIRPAFSEISCPLLARIKNVYASVGCPPDDVQRIPSFAYLKLLLHF